MSDVRTILNTAANILERDGWTQGKLLDPITGCRCAIGALHAAASELGYAFSSVWEASEHARAVNGGQSTVGWNDTRGRTITDVTTLFRNAAKAAA